MVLPELTPEKIKILLDGRKLIEDNRIAKAQVRSSFPEEQLANPEVYKEMQNQLTSIINTTNQGLNNLGFNGAAEFYEFNSEMQYLQLKDCVKYTQYCDHCAGYKKTPPCVITCSQGGPTAEAWFTRWAGTDEQKESLYKYFYVVLRQLIFKEGQVDGRVIKNVSTPLKYDTVPIGYKINPGYCPPGHGFVMEVVKTPTFPLWK